MLLALELILFQASGFPYLNELITSLWVLGPVSMQQPGVGSSLCLEHFVPPAVNPDEVHSNIMVAHNNL